jgi:RNA polymerase sigma-54 factor
MLTLPSIELETMLRQEIQENPLLEINEDYEDDSSVSGEEIKDQDTTDSDQSAPEGNEIEEMLQQTISDSKELSDILDSWNEYHVETGGRVETGSSDDEERGYDNFVPNEENLKLDYINQFDKHLLSEPEYAFIYDLIDNANAYGYLAEDFDIYEIGREYGIDKARADRLHTLVMKAYPRGITARSISECLYHQLEEYEYRLLVAEVILHDFDTLLNRRYGQIAQKYDIVEEDVICIRNRISKLDPKPGLRINSGKPQYIVPDVIVRKIEDDFEIIINDFNIPRINFSRRYQNILSEMSADKNAINYVRSKINSAKFLIKTVFMRNRTLERVMRSIINNQRDLFYNVDGVLEPLTYAVIAAELEVNESTISRVVKNKYADTHLGVFCLKDFFCASAGKDRSSESVSRNTVQQQVKSMIDNEDGSAPLSDQDIVHILSERGIKVSRRVIAKYREEMMIPNSRLRKK